ncbi:hypothetical protein ACQP2F_15455 [Actinoplanes sp. CA-030573]|uniref:hypothetical protein n=1 Tax=Actinoplanes sp. CA-030573 TaxID=3239898 RepID=UPI003D8BF7F9
MTEESEIGVRPDGLRDVADVLLATHYAIRSMAEQVVTAHVTAQQCGDETAAAAINSFVTRCEAGLSLRATRVQQVAEQIQAYVLDVVGADERVADNYADIIGRLPGGRVRMRP